MNVVFGIKRLFTKKQFLFLCFLIRRVSIGDDLGATPLWLAVRHGEVELVKLLIKSGANLDEICGNVRRTSLHMAASEYDVDMVDALLTGGANPDAMDKWNFTPLMYAATTSDPNKAKALFSLLIRGGCNVNFGIIVDENGEVENEEAFNMNVPGPKRRYPENYVSFWYKPVGPTSGTVLHLAVQNPNLPNDCLAILLEAGSDVNKRNLHGQTPLMEAVFDMYYDYHRYVNDHVELLLASGVNVNTTDSRGWTSLHYAAQRGSIQCLHLLINAGAHCNALSHQQESPLWILLVHGWLEATAYFIRNSCDIDHPINATTLITINSDIDVCRYGYITPIEFAICNKYFGIARLLVNLGCKISSSTWLGAGDLHDPSNHRLREFRKFLKYMRTHPRTLSDCCRLSIRRAMDTSVPLKVQAVLLPPSLKDFVCLKEH